MRLPIVINECNDCPHFDHGIDECDYECSEASQRAYGPVPATCPLRANASGAPLIPTCTGCPMFESVRGVCLGGAKTTSTTEPPPDDCPVRRSLVK